MTEREKIMARIQEALTVPAPQPGHGSAQPSTSISSTSPAANARQWLPAVGNSFEERLALFRKNAVDLRADFLLADGREDMAKGLLELSKTEGWKKIGVHAGELTDFACAELGLPFCRTDGGYAVSELEACDVGISECDALVAQTGGVLVTNRSAGGRALSVLPPHHVVLARREQLVADLPEAFAVLKRKYASNYPSFICFITGPSRTSDIERILVLGAHGPKKLTILCF
jgi:L-lactate dehydrogenase complex protein LldG